tara:strand:+ start:4077 stop:5399 length:1323 start_codon:yes stop_codon:yes gene_type:complete
MSLILKLQDKHKDYIRNVGAKIYWPNDTAKRAINELEISDTHRPFEPIWEFIRLPSWASDLEVNGRGLLVDSSSCRNNGYSDWRGVDWWSVAFHFLNGTYERVIEQSKGKPIHSYSYRLPAGHSEMFEYAWVNRIFLFLRRWAAYNAKKAEKDIFPPVTRENILLTHDVDYISKTIPLILKKSVFDIIKVIKLIVTLHLGKAFKTITSSLLFALTPKRYDYFEHILNEEKKFGHKSVFHFYSGKKCINQSWLIDPSYQINEVESAITKIRQMGGEVGLHPSCQCWNNLEQLKLQKIALEKISKKPTQYIRQHWLRFSWSETWKTQALAGLSIDTTLMWNDRPGFRNSSALSFSPFHKNKPITGFTALPTVIMDSHFFDYNTENEDEQFLRLKHYIEEVRFVGGEIAIVWHHRVFHPETGWGKLYYRLLEHIKIDDDKKAK